MASRTETHTSEDRIASFGESEPHSKITLRRGKWSREEEEEEEEKVETASATERKSSMSRAIRDDTKSGVGKGEEEAAVGGGQKPGMIDLDGTSRSSGIESQISFTKP